ncbi:DUF3099 domain-containing protein [Corynebacterium lubricantis]|uniref:DUF3099 domain-containing protein n=1 Tax=Corynebacterium lubricantis TaxID=541095 RepID=UPI000475F7E6|nr:DUF3099 domain-containing protein [Corynebacterium lubricantis]
MVEGMDHDWVDADEPAKSRSKRFRFKTSPAQLITDAIRTPEQNRHSREVRYLILQLSRIPFILISMVLAFTGNWGLAAIFFIISIPLPWISVVIANGKGEVRDKRTRNVYKPAAARYMAMEAERRAALEAGESSGEASDPADDEPTTIDHEDPDDPHPQDER